MLAVAKTRRASNSYANRSVTNPSQSTPGLDGIKPAATTSIRCNSHRGTAVPSEHCSHAIVTGGSRMSMGRLMFLVVSATTLGIVSPAQAQNRYCGQAPFHHELQCLPQSSARTKSGGSEPVQCDQPPFRSNTELSLLASQREFRPYMERRNPGSLPNSAARASARYEDDIPRPEGRKAAGRCNRVSRNTPLTHNHLPPRILVFITLLDSVLVATRANAVPAFAQQTGEPCTTCHIGGFGPQLTPFGRAFKIGGYTQTGGEGLASKIPLSAFVISSFTNTEAGQPRRRRPAFRRQQQRRVRPGQRVSRRSHHRLCRWLRPGHLFRRRPRVPPRQHRSSPDDPALTRRFRTAHRRDH